MYRVLDAAANRGREAVRVIEDAVRFLADDAAMTRALKEFRHDFASLTDRLPMAARLASRAADADVGTAIAAAGEYQRSTIETVLTANFCRLQEALRSLEEFSKLVRPDDAPDYEQLRYRSYTLQKGTLSLFGAAGTQTSVKGECDA
ncbi:MAG: hypothetical protein IIZ25_08985 [Thermoguttaceae bacterium]|nr:hypothetical protein [Thermoguttaceae bacterium]